MLKKYTKSALSLSVPIRLIAVIITLCALCLSLLCITSNAQTESGDGAIYIHDYAGVLSSQDIAQLENKCKEVGAEHDSDIYILITNSTGGLSREQYTSDFSDSREVVNATVLLVNLDPSDRGVYLQKFGTNSGFVTDEKGSDLLDLIIPDLRDESYTKAFQKYLNKLDFYLDGKTDTIFSNIWFQLAVSLAAGAIVVGVMAYNSGGKVTVSTQTYLDQQNSKVAASRDDYVRTTTTKVRKPKNDGPKSGGTGSGSGTTGGGRSFTSNSKNF